MNLNTRIMNTIKIMWNWLCLSRKIIYWQSSLELFYGYSKIDHDIENGGVFVKKAILQNAWVNPIQDEPIWRCSRIGSPCP